MLKLLFFFVILCSFSFISSFSYDCENGNEINIEADQLIYNKKTGIVIGKGRVFIQQNNFQLVTDTVFFDKKNGYLYAVGNLSLKDNKKKYFFGEKAFFNSNNQKGIIIQFQAKFLQKGLFSSNFAEMKENNIFTIKNLTFSTCNICSDNLIIHSPLWQVKAKNATINQMQNKLAFQKSTIEFFGVPIFYFPYFVIRTPNSPRKSGFLTPNFKSSTILFLQISIPYYFNISPQIDLTYTLTKGNQSDTLNNIHFRHLMKYGQYEANGYFINKKHSTKNKFKGYFSSNGEFKFDDDYFLNYKMHKLFGKYKIATKKHDITADDVLTSHFLFRNKKNSRLLTLQKCSFQNSRNNNIYNNSLVWIRNYNKLPLPLKTNLVLSTDILHLQKKGENDYIRGTIKLDLFNYITLPLGQILQINPSIRYDGYRIIKSQINRSENKLIANLYLDWKWPLIKSIGNNSMILEPVVKFIYSTGALEISLDNKDSLPIDSISSIFLSNFFIGKDMMKAESKLNLGIKSNVCLDRNLYGIILGQSYKLNTPHDNIKNYQEHSSYTWDNPLNALKSKFIGKFYMQWHSTLSIINNIYVIPNKFHYVKNEVKFYFMYKKSGLKLNHVFFNKKHIDSKNEYSQEMNVELRHYLNMTWGLDTKIKRNLGSQIKLDITKKSKWISHRLGLFYKGDCVKINFGVERDYSKLNRHFRSSVTTYLNMEPIFY